MGAPVEVKAHWHLLVDDLNTSALGFYDSVEKAVRERHVPDVETARIEWPEGGFFTGRRTYLRIRRGRLYYDICSGPYGTGYFFSSWMCVQPPSLVPFREPLHECLLTCDIGAVADRTP